MDHAYTVTQGNPSPMGATPDSAGVNFALFSEHGTAVTLCLFDSEGQLELARVPLHKGTGGVWHAHVADLRPGAAYGYRVDGPYEPKNGHRFNSNKLLLDPYAKAYVGEVIWAPEIFGYIFETGDDTTFDTRDSAASMPKCLVAASSMVANGTLPQAKPRVPWSKTVLYELHVKGYTKLHPDILEEQRGTYAGLGQPAVVDYIRSLGITSVELLPVHAFLDESHLRDLGLTNYWGYNTIGFFAAHAAYATQPDRALEEFRAMVERCHEAGLEVLLDVVYNHTAEGGERGPTLSFRGIDNRSYYRLQADNPRYYVNDAGTGNTVDASHPRVVEMICDSLRYWMEEGGVDGFRFDLAPILAREQKGFNPQSLFFQAVAQDPVLSRAKLIAEPWDVGPGGYRFGEFPKGWAEWNDTFRNSTRNFWIGKGDVAEQAEKLAGSPAVFATRARQPWAAVNFITAHDGFTLHDLVSYSSKHNLANGEGNRDGSNDNRSSNCGAEGPTRDPAVLRQRERQMRNLLGTLLLSQGTPMLLAGDEFAHTQRGNNNAYCQDNEISWTDWTLQTTHQALVRYTSALLRFRREYPLLNSGLYPGQHGSGELSDIEVTWLSPQSAAGTPHTPNQAAQSFGMFVCQPVQNEQAPTRSTAKAIALLLNATGSVMPFSLPVLPLGSEWQLLVDTNSGETATSAAPMSTYEVAAMSLVLLAEESV